LRWLLTEATAALAEAGLDSARTDAELLAAHVLGVDRGRLAVMSALGTGVHPADRQRFHELIAQRTTRTPVQLLIGTIEFYGVSLQVRQGVFIPRPETELVAQAGHRQLADRIASDPAQTLRVVDLCTG